MPIQLDNLPILYSFRRCPYAMRARMALIYSGIECILREVDLKAKPEHMLKASPKGTVPVLILANGDIIDESMDIINFALNKHDPIGVLEQEKNHLHDIEELISNNDESFTPLLRQYKYFEKHPASPKEETLKKIEANFLSHFEDMLSKSRFLINDKISKADIALFPFIRQNCS